MICAPDGLHSVVPASAARDVIFPWVNPLTPIGSRQLSPTLIVATPSQAELFAVVIVAVQLKLTLVGSHEHVVHTAFGHCVPAE